MTRSQYIALYTALDAYKRITQSDAGNTFVVSAG